VRCYLNMCLTAHVVATISLAPPPLYGLNCRAVSEGGWLLGGGGCWKQERFMYARKGS